MAMIQDTVKNLRLPALLDERQRGVPETAKAWEARRLELVDLLCREVYGYVPAFEGMVSAACVEKDEGAYAGKATVQTLNLTVTMPQGVF